jgi:pimeloyl-ACP methyl ester carboxylesterase
MEIKGGQQKELRIFIDRQGRTEAMQVRLEGLPQAVTHEPGDVGPGENQARVKLQARADADHFEGDITVSLWVGDTEVDSGTMTLIVRQFLRPQMGAVESITLPLGGSRTVKVEVIRRGNTDPLTLEADGLPAWVTQKKVDAAGDSVALRLEARADGPPWSDTIHLVLKADGIEAERKMVRLWVESEPGAVMVGLQGPQRLEMRPGEKPILKVVVTRKGGYKGPVTLKLADQPRGISCADTILPEGENTALLQVWAAEDASAPFDTKVHIVALVNGRHAGVVPLTIRVDHRVAGRGAVDTPGKTVPRAESVQIKTADGVTLAGTFYPSPEGQDGATVLMLHELGKSCNASWADLASELQKAGYGVLTFDFRGHGQSTAFDGTFWLNPVNRRHLSLGTAVPRPTSLRGIDLPPSYLPWLVQDIVAARHWLDLKHDDGQVNSSNLIILAAGDAVLLGGTWLIAEQRRHKTPGGAMSPISEGRDVVAAVWLGFSWPARRRYLTPQNLSDQVTRDRKVPEGFIYGENDAVGVNAAARLRSGRRERIEAIRVPATNRTGQQLAFVAQKQILSYLEKVIKAHSFRKHALKHTAASAFAWATPMGLPPRVNAKPADSRSPYLLPLNYFGFPSLR